MIFLEWNDRMKIGVVEIDIQHRALLDIINLLAEVIAVKEYDRKAGRILNEFDRFIRYHFETEEEMFIKNGYTDEAHLFAHNEILLKLDRMKKSDCSEGKCLDKILKIAKELFLSHTLTLDKKFGLYMQNLDKIADMA